MQQPIIRTADVCDALDGAVRLVTARFRDFGARESFWGRIATVVTVDDNVRVKELVATPGDGRVVVVDGGGSVRHALMGGNVAATAQRNGWAGALIHGCVRDQHEIAEVEMGVKALNTSPRRPLQDGAGALDVPVVFAGVIFHPGEYLYADEDGIVVSDKSPEDLGLA